MNHIVQVGVIVSDSNFFIFSKFKASLPYLVDGAPECDVECPVHQQGISVLFEVLFHFVILEVKWDLAKEGQLDVTEGIGFPQFFWLIATAAHLLY